MSVRSLVAISVDRDTAGGGLSASGSVTSRRERRASRPRPASDVDRVADGYAAVLIAAIPTEVLAVYTFVVGVVVGTIDAGDPDHLLLRWILYGVGIGITLAWLAIGHRRAAGRRRLPLLEMLTAGTAFAVWGLVMPGSPLSATLEGDSRAIWSAILTGAGVIALGLLGTPLQRPSDRN